MAEFNIPGVYSEIDASAAVQSISPNDSVIGIVAKCEKGTDNKAFAPTSFEDARAKLGADSNAIKLMSFAMKNGGNKFIIVKPKVTAGTPETVDYKTALEVLELEEAVNIVLVDSTEATVHSQVKEHCLNASDNRRERIAFLGLAVESDAASAIGAATPLNSGRVYISYPNGLDETGTEMSGIYTAAALAGQVAAEQDPSMPMTNVKLNGFYGLSKKLKDDEMNNLILGGVIPLEVRNGDVRIVRAVSTYTKDATGTTDITWQELTVTRISDYIFKDMRAALTKKFSRAKQNKKARDAVKSECLTRLNQYQTLEYIENVANEDVTIQINPMDPFRSDVVFKYDVVGPMNVIHLTGHLVI